MTGNPTYLSESYFDYLCPLTITRAVDLAQETQPEELAVKVAALNMASPQEVELMPIQSKGEVSVKESTAKDEEKNRVEVTESTSADVGKDDVSDHGALDDNRVADELEVVDEPGVPGYIPVKPRKSLLAKRICAAEEEQAMKAPLSKTSTSHVQFSSQVVRTQSESL
jgi:hypothetical protein